MKSNELTWIDAGFRLREVGATVVAYGMKSTSAGIVDCRDFDGGWKWDNRPEMVDLYTVIFKLPDAVVCTSCDTVQDVFDICANYTLDEPDEISRLIAAAPAMLAALKELADAYQFAWKVGVRVDDVDNAATRYKIIAAAITKATGADPRVVDYDQESERDE